MLLAKQLAKFAVARLNARSCIRILPSGYFYTLEVDPMAPLNIDYIPVVYYFDGGFYFLIPCRDDCNPDIIVSPALLDIYIYQWI